MHRKYTNTREAMTLIEVVVVLALLAGLATMTLGMLDGLDDRTRSEHTRDRAEVMREAVLGNGIDAGRFLADTGRLPVLQDLEDGRCLSEFFDCPHDSVLGGTVTFTLADDLFGETLPGLPDTVVMPCGWRGPYVLTSGNRFYDGFGGDWHLRLADAPSTWRDPVTLDVANLGTRIVGVAGWGRDGVQGGSTWADEDETVDFGAPAAEASLSITLVLRDNTELGRNAWKPISETDPWSAYGAWRAATVYVKDQLVLCSTGDALFRCTGAGTSGAAEPAWNRDRLGDSTDDGTVTWMLAADRRAYANRVRVALFVPYTPTRPDAANGVRLVALVARETDGTPSAFTSPDKSADMATMPRTWTGRHHLLYTGLAPGPRKLLACAFVDDGGGTYTNAWHSPVMDVYLQPGANTITLYLGDPLE